MQAPPITLKDLIVKKEFKRFSGETPADLAGRCLLDALEFLRIDPKWSARFGPLMNAHAIRLCWCCVKKLKRDDVALRIHPLVELTYGYLLGERQNEVPFYGDDFWDWAYILEAMLTVHDGVKTEDREKALEYELAEFYRAVKDNLNDGLTLNKPGEWFGPAIPTAAHRLLTMARRYIKNKSELAGCLAELKKQALTPIANNKYLGRLVQPAYQHWHIGQVVAEFPQDTAPQQRELRKLDKIRKLRDRTERAYSLARVLQGAVAVKDEVTRRAALKMLYGCENQSRPLGTGIIGDQVKASLNTLEAIWPSLNASDFKEIKDMLDAFLAAQKRWNRVGVLVALERERDACIQQFEVDGATVSGEDVIVVDHPDYEAVIITGKALLGATHATLNLIKEHGATRTLMVGIAGSLGEDDEGGKFKGPVIGDVVIATATAGYRLREKVRETVTDAPVPFSKTTWNVLPADVTLFAHSHRAWLNLKRKLTVHEGLIVTGNGIKDDQNEKRKVREKWPGGLAVAEEGFASALGCLHYNIPYLEIRGISDLAQGDKQEQKSDPKKEERDQKLAAVNAAKIALALVKSLSKRW
jgi:nucleoside phosphorylase